MSDSPDFEHMSDAERAVWHEARRGTRDVGRVVRRQTRDRAQAHLSVRLQAEQIQRLRELSAREGRTVSALVRRFVEQKLDELAPREMPTEGSGQTVVPDYSEVLTAAGLTTSGHAA